MFSPGLFVSLPGTCCFCPCPQSLLSCPGGSSMAASLLLSHRYHTPIPLKQNSCVPPPNFISHVQLLASNFSISVFPTDLLFLDLDLSAYNFCILFASGAITAQWDLRNGDILSLSSSAVGSRGEKPRCWATLSDGVLRERC